MDFDPEHEKWQWCCCRITTGVKLLGAAETVLAGGVVAFAVHLLKQHAQTDKDGYFFPFDVSLLAIAALFGLTSFLVCVGAHLRKEKLLYPSVCVRVMLVIFVTVFGVSIGVVSPEVDDDSVAPTRAPFRGAGRRRPTTTPRPDLVKLSKQEEPSTALRLLFLMFLMIVVSVVVFYTIFIVVRTINFLKSSKRSRQRRNSFFNVGQLHPSLMAEKRPSQCSQLQF